MSRSPVMAPLENGRFRFACHRRMPCFTRCCADLNLVLTPYDILRLKQRLGLSSGRFLEQYTDDQIDAASGLPLVRLKMDGGGFRRCPFVQPEGCTVYEDRPGACRLYPPARAASQRPGGGRAAERYFLVKETHCLGWQEKTQWTVDAWLADQGLLPYNAKNDAFAGVFSARPQKVLKGLTDRHRQMVFMACYDLDGFRCFLFESTFLDRFALEDGLKRRLETDDEPLLDFAGRWLRFALFGEMTLAFHGGAASEGR